MLAPEPRAKCDRFMNRLFLDVMAFVSKGLLERVGMTFRHFLAWFSPFSMQDGQCEPE